MVLFINKVSTYSQAFLDFKKCRRHINIIFQLVVSISLFWNMACSLRVKTNL